MIKIVGVRFRNAGKVYYFDPGTFVLRQGGHVIVETSKGPEYGTVSTSVKMVEDDQVSQPLRAVIREASEEDEEKVVQFRRKEKEALKVCREKAREHKLDMKVVGAEYAFDGSRMLFYFTADGRVDFRELVKDLAAVFHMRIELRQIGVRDETRMLGGLGTCGRELCCATYLHDFQPVSIKMAKEQNLSLNPSKISGVCGRLMCCLKNEEETYAFLNAKMPKIGSEAVTADGQSGKVIELDVLRQRVKVLFEEGDTKEAEVFPAEQLTFRPRKKNASQDKPRPGKDDAAREGTLKKEGVKPDPRPGQSRGTGISKGEDRNRATDRSAGGKAETDARSAETQAADENKRKPRRRKPRPGQEESSSGENKKNAGKIRRSDNRQSAGESGRQEEAAGSEKNEKKEHYGKRRRRGTSAKNGLSGEKVTSEMKIYAGNNADAE